MGESKKPIFDAGDREIEHFTLKCNDCDQIDQKIQKHESDYNVKKRGISEITNNDTKNRMLQDLDKNYNEKINRLKSIKERNCR